MKKNIITTIIILFTLLSIIFGIFISSVHYGKYKIRHGKPQKNIQMSTIYNEGIDLQGRTYQLNFDEYHWPFFFVYNAIENDKVFIVTWCPFYNDYIIFQKKE